MKPIYTRNRTIGLLGGSFNPAHSGHLHITLYALNKLKFDEVWWLVSPHNPLKKLESLADYGQRLQSAELIAAGHPKIRVLDFEARAHTQYSYQTVDLIKKRYPGTKFAWLMGADNLANFHRWQHWQKLQDNIPVVVFDRAPYSHTSLRSKAFLRGRRFLSKTIGITSFVPPCGQLFIHLKRSPVSSTILRKSLGTGAFLGHNNKAGAPVYAPAGKEQSHTYKIKK